MILSDRIQSIKPSATIAMSNKAMALKQQGIDVISLAAGEPDFDTPEAIKAAGIAAIEAGKTKYTQVDGTPELKQAAIKKFQRDNGLSYTPEEILISSGAKHSISNLFGAILNPGDEVIVPAPAWVSYPDMALLCGARPVVVSTTLENHLKMTPDQLAQAITPKTKCLVLNSPSNPTGMVYSREELAMLGEILLQHPQVMIMTDDIYEHIRWTGEDYCNIVNACPELMSRTIVVNGVSKAYAMTGWRIGVAAGPKEIIAAMKKMQSQSTSNPCSISQAAATQALGGDQACLKPMVAAFKERHDFVLERLNTIDGFHCLPGQGAFYAFPEVSSTIKKLGLRDDVELATYLLEHARVAVVPGTAFLAPGFIRLSYATGLEQLQAALDQIAAVV